MNHLFRIIVIPILLIGSTLFFTSCKAKPTLAVVTTANVTDKTQTTATSGGNVTSDGNAEVTARGVCWGTSQNPTTGSNKTSDGTGTGNFTSSITGLTPGTTYYVRAYATNSEGTSYGNEVTFSSNPVLLATLTTTTATSITQTTAASGGNISSDGGGAVTARGVCWATTANPTIVNSKTSDGTGSGSFTSTIQGLTSGTKYYLRAYATNTAGTAYGSEVTFTTDVIKLPAVTTSAVSSKTNNSAVSGGNVTSDGGGTITVRGVCWSTSPSPVIAGSHTTDGGTAGSFTSNITGLSEATLYYVRAYATNSAGTSYGSEVLFTTLMSDIEGVLYNTVVIGNQIWMAENLKTTKFNDDTNIPIVTDNTVWNILTTPAYCWYNNDMAAYKDTYGALYNWDAVNTGKLCPVGWHVPTRTEFADLVTFLGGESVAGGKLKETGLLHWIAPNQGATNESGFTALPAGIRSGSFIQLGWYTYWWTGTGYVNSFGNTDAYFIRVRYEFPTAESDSWSKTFGLSIRCLKN